MTTAEMKQFDGDFEALLDFIREHRGFDFTGYKRASLTRRIGKRMQEVGISSYDEYRDHLKTNSDEFVSLFNTILINVTSFFRDDIAWTFLREDVIPRIVDARAGTAIRIWSTGCATGEEAYSLAMVFAEAVGEEEFRHRVKIYATDVDDDALNQGRHATYTPKQMEPVAPELRERYFDQTNSNFVFRKDLRRSVIFGRHDLVQDPPISKVDLLVCRNTLMYFDTPTQHQILMNFHFALRDEGYLFLGKSEALAARTNLFAAIDLKRRVFMKVPRTTRRAPRLELNPEAADAPETATESLVRDVGFDAVPVAYIVVDKEERLVLANLQARMLFGIAQRDLGSPFKDLEVSFRPLELRSRLQQARDEGHAISLREIEWQVGNDVRHMDVQITPLVAASGDHIGVAISFGEVTRYRRLQEALQESKREVETAYEELQSTVEELETTNEELQSTNEELETTNEELQSSNEELETMNSELHERSTELNETNAFLDAVLGTLDAGVVVVNDELQIDAWNRGARDLWGFTEDEVLGRNFLNLDIGLPVGELRQPIWSVLSGDSDGGASRVELEAVNRRGRTIQVHVALTPLRTARGQTRGVILTMHPSGDGAVPAP